MKKFGTLLTALCLLVSGNQLFAENSMDYLEPKDAVPHSKAPGLKVKLLSNSNGVQNYVLVFAENDEVLSGIEAFAKNYNVKSAHYTAIGAFKRAISAWYDTPKKEYKLHRIDQQVELVSLIGNIALHDGKPVVHAHFAVGYPDGKMEGGHLIEAYVSPTVELFITVEPISIDKITDKNTGLNLMDLESIQGTKTVPYP